MREETSLRNAVKMPVFSTAQQRDNWAQLLYKIQIQELLCTDMFKKKKEKKCMQIMENEPSNNFHFAAVIENESFT